MNRLISLLILIIVLGCSDSKKNRKETISKSIEKTEPIKEEIISKSETQKNEFTETEKEIAVVALSFHNWYIKNTNEIKSEIPTDFVVTEGENDSCIVNYEPYFNELRKLGTISNSFMEKEKERTKLCAENISKMNWSEYVGVIPENCDDYLFWTRSQEETSGIELMSIKKEKEIWKVKYHLFNTFGNEKSYSPYTGIITVEKEEKGYMITEINWN
ncbi:hypothetical protein [Tenacibaculum finnmarkense]|uniref:hypothetical protein n=1 Tax=Tenacibaculum finnmarkense TaxID=2781243 RepID=UPI001E3793D8|nr:hypothetical protein [Tenacibaculum finnmarkense]MCD8423680.1 hypothetical protein [Tenacibaculum finnmarkense genomovar ulcerans]MCG8239834.1 hypothetical protein [Tenacibaculum finnmarkense genomovar ulcerans]MCG8859993.1 hypothetical protein [Tenacibaculum finnmarkense]